ncbi:hypothetical protein [Pontibacter mangrovi]|uniref:Uncharacterized protein n=1 Tax=Pontibacter mangrovi TaxID=2589816 RepID=A0A501W2Y6_9BACT|nr:hypothetical protein [Pontibacter mangrovi]TPE44273.1 hypothetical protein FJM65_08950 [Pontibacter mangrovi]
MKKNTLYRLAGLLLILAASLKMMHVPNASWALTFALAFGLLVQSWHVKQLEEKLEEYGVYQNKSLVYGIRLALVAGIAAMKILHVPFSDYLFLSPLMIGVLVQGGYIRHIQSKLNKQSQV